MAHDGTMNVFYEIVLGAHIVAGTVALLVFWIPLVTIKGGRTHRRAGWVYVYAAATVAVTGLVTCGRLLSEGRPARWRAGAFLAYVALFAGESAYLGVRALRARGRPDAWQRAGDVVGPTLLIGGGVALAALGAHRANVLYVFFAALGVTQGAEHFRFWLTAAAHGRERFFAHMTAMGTSCITTLTAFVVVNAQRFGIRTFDPGLWIAPIAVLGIGLAIWRRSYEKRVSTG